MFSTDAYATQIYTLKDSFLKMESGLYHVCKHEVYVPL